MISASSLEDNDDESVTKAPITAMGGRDDSRMKVTPRRTTIQFRLADKGETAEVVKHNS